MGDFHSSLNHMNRNSGSSGLRPGLGGNQQHMNNACGRRKGDEGGGKERKGKEGFLSKFSKHCHTLWSDYQASTGGNIFSTLKQHHIITAHWAR